MKHLTFISDKSRLVRQAIAAWLILFVSTLLFATLSTLFYYNGRGREEGILLSLLIVGLLATLAHVLCYRLDYSYTKLREMLSSRSSYPTLSLLELPLGIAFGFFIASIFDVSLISSIFGSSHLTNLLELTLSFAMGILLYRYLSRLKIIRIECEVERLKHQIEEQSHPITHTDKHTVDKEYAE
jgi:high-affinity Fe2+/Pb2+ permease